MGNVGAILGPSLHEFRASLVYLRQLLAMFGVILSKAFLVVIVESYAGRTAASLASASNMNPRLHIGVYSPGFLMIAGAILGAFEAMLGASWRYLGRTCWHFGSALELANVKLEKPRPQICL